MRAIALAAFALLTAQAAPALALHGDPIRPEARGVERHYDLLSAGGELWRARLDAALIKIDCGTGNARSAHLAREADGGVRVYTTWHGVAGLISPRTSELSQTCRIRFGRDEDMLQACRLVDLDAPTREQPARMYRRYYDQFRAGDYAAMFETTRQDWARFSISCAGGRGEADYARLQRAALPILGRTLENVEAAIGQARVQYVAVGAITLGDAREPRVMSATIADDQVGRLDLARSSAHQACVFSNYADVGMSGGFLAAIINPGEPSEQIGLVCVINSQPPPRARSGPLSGVPQDDPDARMMHVDVRNFGAFYPAE